MANTCFKHLINTFKKTSAYRMKAKGLDTKHINSRHGQIYPLTLFTVYLENQNIPPKAQDVYCPYYLLNKRKKSYFRWH